MDNDNDILYFNVNTKELHSYILNSLKDNVPVSILLYLKETTEGLQNMGTGVRSDNFKKRGSIAYLNNCDKKILNIIIKFLKMFYLKKKNPMECYIK